MFYKKARGAIKYILHKLLEAFLTNNTFDQSHFEDADLIGQHGIKAIGDLLFVRASDTLMDAVDTLFTEVIG